MNVIITLNSDLAERLKHEAAREGKSLEAYLTELVGQPAIDDSGAFSAGRAQTAPAARKRSLLELKGVGADLWKDIEPQDCVDESRREWDHRPRGPGGTTDHSEGLQPW